jgi:putative NADH-flavin reductase
MQRLALLGADSKLGETLVARALSSGYQVHALGRRLDGLPHRHNENLSAFRGDLASGAGLEPALAGCRFVVCGLEPSKPVMAAMMQRLLHVVSSPPLRRLVRVAVGSWRERPAQGRKRGTRSRPHSASSRRLPWRLWPS